MNEHHLAITRHARFFSLGNLDTARDVWIVVHGFGQLAADFLAPFKPFAGDGRAIVAPEALNRFYKPTALGERTHGGAPVGATWMTREDRETEIADYVAYLDALAAQVAGEGRQLTALGFSQGVATVTRWIARGRARVDRLIVWAGEIPADVDITASVARFPRAPIDVVIGSVDEVAPWVKIDDQRARFEAAGLAIALRIFDGGHRLDRKTLQALVAGTAPD